MKKTMKPAVSLCVALCLVLGGVLLTSADKVPSLIPKGSKAYPAVGEWRPFMDNGNGGSSTAELTSAVETIGKKKNVTTYTVKGNVTTKYQYGYAGWAFDPDNATLERLKNAAAITFTIKTQGQQFAVKYLTSDCESDYCYFEYPFIETEPGVAKTFTVPMQLFNQPAWGAQQDLVQANFTGLEWQTHESWRKTPNNNPFEVTIYDLIVHVAPPVKGAKAAAAPALPVGNMGAFDLKLDDNFQYGEGYQGKINKANLLGGYKIVGGETWTVKFTYTASRDLEQDIEAGFVDPSPPSYWKHLTSDADGKDGFAFVIPKSKAGEKVTGTWTFKTTKAASSGSANANSFYFDTKGEGKKGSAGSGKMKPVTLSFTEFVLTKQ
jgi:hypothetical protein